jgi:hypothetical protein
MSESVPGVISQLGLTLTVLTSDDVRFVSGVSDPVEGDPDGPVEALYSRLVAGLTEKPALLMPFFPFMVNVGGDEFIAALDKVSGGLPAFGTLAVSGEMDMSNMFVIYNEGYYPASLALLALLGDVNPAFFSVSVTDENILKAKAVVTETDRNLLRRVNNIPAVKYFESLGIVSGDKIDGIRTMPIIVYLEDGSKLIRACVDATDDGSAVLCGAVPVKSTIALSTMGQEDVIRSTEAILRDVAAVSRGKGVLMYSCAGRNYALGIKWMAEHETARACIGGDTPYSFSYSGGEIFPERLADGKTVNHLQNDSVIICVL